MANPEIKNHLLEVLQCRRLSLVLHGAASEVNTRVVHNVENSFHIPSLRHFQRPPHTASPSRRALGRSTRRALGPTVAPGAPLARVDVDSLGEKWIASAKAGARASESGPAKKSA